MIRGAIQVGPHAIPFGPITLGSSIEWAFESDRIKELRAASQQTGGRELLDLTTAWLRPPYIQDTSLRLPLCLFLLGLVIIEALLARTGWKLPTWNLVPRVALPKPVKVRKVKSKQPEPEPLVIAKEEKPVFQEMEPEETNRRSRFQKAKDRK